LSPLPSKEVKWKRIKIKERRKSIDAKLAVVEKSPPKAK